MDFFATRDDLRRRTGAGARGRTNGRSPTAACNGADNRAENRPAAHIFTSPSIAADPVAVIL
jgi:hypothetical protein